MIHLSLVMGTYNRLSSLKRAIAAIVASSKPLNIEIVINDGGSTDGTVEWLEQQKDKGLIVPIFSGNLEGITKAYNKCFKRSSGKYIIWLSDDQIPIEDALKKMYYLMDRTGPKDVGAFSSRNFNTEPFCIPRVGGKYCPVILCIRNELLKNYGYWDEDFPYYGQESEFNSRIYRMGGKIHPFDECKIDHLNEQDHLKEENLHKYKLTGFFGKYQMIYKERFGKRSKFLRLAFLIIPVDGAKLPHIVKATNKMRRYFKNPHYFIETNNADIIKDRPVYAEIIRVKEAKTSREVSIGPHNKYWDAYDLVVAVAPNRSWVVGPNRTAVVIPFSKELLK